MLIRQARNQVQYLFVSMATRHQQLLNAKDSDEYISILEEQSSQTMNSLSVCLDLLCEEQIFAWRWRSRCKQLGKQLEDVRNLFSTVNIQASRITRKKQRMVGSVLYKEYIKSDLSESKPKTSDNISLNEFSTMPQLARPNMRLISTGRKLSTPTLRSDQRPNSTKSNLSFFRADGDRSSMSSIVSFPELEVGYITSIE